MTTTATVTVPAPRTAEPATALPTWPDGHQTTPDDCGPDGCPIGVQLAAETERSEP